MIDDLLLRGVVTALFVATAVMFAIASWVHRRTAGYVVSGALHIVMAVAMIAMAWPQGAALPPTGPMVFFLLAAVYFVVVVFAQAGHRLANAYHAAMMLAMAWMYAVMSGDLAPAPAEGSVPAGGHGGLRDRRGGLAVRVLRRPAWRARQTHDLVLRDRRPGHHGRRHGDHVRGDALSCAVRPPSRRWATDAPGDGRVTRSAAGRSRVVAARGRARAVTTPHAARPAPRTPPRAGSAGDSSPVPA